MKTYKAFPPQQIGDKKLNAEDKCLIFIDKKMVVVDPFHRLINYC